MKNVLPKISCASAVLASAAMATAPVFAEGVTYTPIAGTNTTFTKTISMRETANVPNVTFHYAVAAGAAQPASNGKLAVFAGNDADKTNGKLPTIADITFTASDAKETDKLSAKHTGTIDFSGVQYKEPGVYRYVITESGTCQGLSTEEDQTKAVDVYVIDNNGILEVAGYVMHNDEGAAAEQLSETKRLDDKDLDFLHTLTTSDVVLSKTVTGNQGSHDEYFKFTVKITGADPNTKFSVDLANADATTKTNGINLEAHTNPDVIVAGADGSVTQDFWLQHNQSIKIEGLAANTGYNVVEDNGSYKTTTAVTGDTTNVATNDIATGNGATVTDAEVKADTTVAYTNNKQGAIPTGLFMSVGGAAVVTLLGGAGIATMVMRKKEEE